MSAIDLIMLICATWYISYCLVNLAGPFGIFGILRKWLAVMTCIYCLSLWIGMVLYAFVYVGQTDIIYVCGLVGAGHLLSSWTGANYWPPTPPDYGD